jgi:hypothetical protein
MMPNDGYRGTDDLVADSTCDLCGLQLYDGSRTVGMMFLCRHIVHQRCVDLVNADDLPVLSDAALTTSGLRTASVEDYIAERLT